MYIDIDKNIYIYFTLYITIDIYKKLDIAIYYRYLQKKLDYHICYTVLIPIAFELCTNFGGQNL